MNGPTAEDLERRRMIDARNDAGARAWSPSRAREALKHELWRAITGKFKASEYHIARIRLGIESPFISFDSEQAYIDWCHLEIGAAPTPWRGPGRFVG